jgi:hypothetical protein
MERVKWREVMEARTIIIIEGCLDSLREREKKDVG